MIKCGKLKGKNDKVAEQCILFTRDGSRALGYFLYSKYGGQKGAKRAAHKREGQIQAFKKKHQGLLDAVETFGAPVVLKYLLDKADDCEACQEMVASYVEKARGEGLGVGGERQGDGGVDQCVCPKCGTTAAHEKGTPCNEMKCPKCGAPMTGKSAEKSEAKVEKKAKKEKKPYGGSFSRMWSEKYGGSVEKCIKMVGDTVSDPGAYCAWLKDKALKRTTWRGKGKHERKSFEEIAEEALQMLQKHEEEEETLDMDLAALEEWLSETEVDETPSEEPAPEAEPEGEPPPESPPEPEPEEVAEELPNDFRTFLLRDHAERQAGVLALLGEEGEEAE